MGDSEVVVKEITELLGWEPVSLVVKELRELLGLEPVILLVRAHRAVGMEASQLGG